MMTAAKRSGLRAMFQVSLLTVFAFAAQPASGQDYVPVVSQLNGDDAVFQTLRAEILINSSYFRINARNNGARPVSYAQSEIPPLRFYSYTLSEGDDLVRVAQTFGLNIDTLVSVNTLPSVVAVGPGDVIAIPNINGIIVEPDTREPLDSLAAEYDVASWAIAQVNGLPRNYVVPGDQLLIPGARLSQEERSFSDLSAFVMPLNSGRLSSRMGYRTDPFHQRRTFHGGIDIAAPTGTPVYAARGGKVVFAGRLGGYGNLVILEHAYGYKTYYGHLSRILVSEGQQVLQRALVGQVGSTGRSTGPHLHFEIRRFNSRHDPMSYLQGGDHIHGWN